MDKALISIFEKIRDEPLEIPENYLDKDNRCWGKSRRLYALLTKEGYNVRYRVCSFKWSKQRFPKEILEIPHKDNDFHLYLEIRIKNKWIKLDCSNDCLLPEYNSWNGKEDCKIEVNYEKIFSPKKSLEIENQEKRSFQEDIKENKQFYSAVNTFLKKIRKKY
ncbi:MAG: hypothetical protein AABX11_00640 [Nanoarchaeota archaeon]